MRELDVMLNFCNQQEKNEITRHNITLLQPTWNSKTKMRCLDVMLNYCNQHEIRREKWDN